MRVRPAVAIAALVLAAGVAALVFLRGDDAVPAAPLGDAGGVAPRGGGAVPPQQRKSASTEAVPQQTPADVRVSEPRIRLQCVGADGRPVEGVELAIAARAQQVESPIDRGFAVGPDAIASFSVPRMRGVDTALEFFATALTPLAEPVRVPLTIDPPPAAPVRVTLPPVGTLTVKLVATDGTPWTGQANVSIQLATAGHPGTSWTFRSAKDGVAVFPGVGVGLALEAQVNASGPPSPNSRADAPLPRRITTRTRIEGPASDGSLCEVTLRVGEPQPAVVGRLVDAGGRPITGCPLTAQIETASGAPMKAFVQLDREGWFRAEFDAELPDSGVTLSLLSASRWDAPAREILRRPWARAEAPGIDVGYVRAEFPEPESVTTIVAGRFDAPAGCDPTSGYVMVMRRVEGNWWSTDLRATANSDGEFVVRGVPPQGDEPLYLFGGATDGLGAVLDAPVEFKLGDRDVRARLVPVGGFGGSVIMPAGVEALGALRVLAEGESARNGRPTDLRDPPYVEAMWNGQWFSAHGLKPGPVSVVFRTAVRSEPIFRIDGVEIRAGETTQDPRLAKVDLTRLAQPAEFRIAGEDGKPLAGAELWTRPVLPPDTRGVGWWKTLADAAGTVRVATFGQRIDAIAMSPGRVPAEATSAAKPTTLVLAPAQPSEITIRLSPTVEFPSTPFSLGVRLVWYGSADLPLTSDFDRFIDPRSIAQVRNLHFGADRTVRLEVTEPGRWRALVVVERHGGGSKPLRPQRSTEVLVTTSPQRLEIQADVDAAALAAACRELSR